MTQPFFITVLLLSALATGCKSSSGSPELPAADAVSQATTPQGGELVWIVKPDEAKSCATQKGIMLEVMADELKKANIKIHQKKKIRDTRPKIQMCGVDRGDMNGFLVSKQDAEKAVALLGFKPYSAP